MHRYRIFGFEACPFQPIQRHRPSEMSYSHYRDYIDMEAMLARPEAWGEDTTSTNSESEDWKVESSADEITAVLGEISSSEDEDDNSVFLKGCTSEDEESEPLFENPVILNPEPVPEVVKKSRPPKKSSKTPTKRKLNELSDMDKIMEKEMENMRKSKELQEMEKSQKIEKNLVVEKKQEVEKTQVPAVPSKKRKSPDLMSRLKSKQPCVSRKAPAVNLKGLTPIVVPPAATSSTDVQSPEPQPMNTSPQNNSLSSFSDSGIMCNSIESSSTTMIPNLGNNSEERVPLILVEPVRPDRTQLILKIKLGSNPQSELKYDLEPPKSKRIKKCSKCRRQPREDGRNGMECFGSSVRELSKRFLEFRMAGCVNLVLERETTKYRAGNEN
ncbi:hypothetical protein FO519_002506 [Halicephalobus sp. NKZ332]|nr:hypothetical protein FO519_002506 [Halicephalobus sp. NKZ332]